MPRGLIILILLLAASPLVAGMPSITISDLWTMRLQSISFFLLVLALSAHGVMGLWNYLRRDFRALPRLTYLRSLSLVILLGLLFMVVLTMISGARELMTPGAWRKQGATYVLGDGPDAEDQRRKQVEALRAALWRYADQHDGRLPPHDGVSDIDAQRWLLPGSVDLRYIYLPGNQRGGVKKPLAYEPGKVGATRFVLYTDGDITSHTTAELLALLAQPSP